MQRYCNFCHTLYNMALSKCPNCKQYHDHRLATLNHQQLSADLIIHNT